MKRNSGFSLVEFLVVLAIIVMLVSLLLPVFIQSREAARRVGCINNLKQLILATQSYYASNNVLPSGSFDGGGPLPETDEGDRMSWITSLLPYNEQYTIFNMTNFSLGVLDPQNHSVRMATMSSLLCPSSYRGRWAHQYWPTPLPAGMDGMSSYAGCHHDVEAPIDLDNHGVFFRNSRIRHIDVTDGLSQTLFIGEVAEPSPLGWMSGSRATLRNTGHPINEELRRQLEKQEVAVPPRFVGGFASKHGDGADFAFGDGSVRFLKEAIDPGVLRLLGNRSDGEAIDDSSY
jgi:prepilin-type N-terminal cleavage/methylation domain-containing protein/prepilin-type processing-associated H-X9-DG protein